MRKYLVLDTNMLPMFGNFDTPFWKALHALCESKGITLAVSEVTLEEAVNIRVEKSAKAASTFRTAHVELSKFHPSIESTFVPDPDEMGRAYRSQTNDLFEVLLLSGDDAKEALRRESRRIAPARGGSGGRDAAIWLSIIALLRQGHEVFFVSKNTKDFGADVLFDTLAADVAATSGSILYFTSSDDFLAHIATPVQAPTVTDEELREAFTVPLAYRITRNFTSLRAGSDTIRMAYSRLTLSNTRFAQSYIVDGNGLVYVTADFDMRNDEEEDVWVTGKFGGWLNFDPVSSKPTQGDVDSISIEPTLEQDFAISE